MVANIAFAEAPIFDRCGNLYFVNYLRKGTIGRMTPAGTVSVWCQLDGTGQANGLKVDSQGFIIAADQGGRRILRIDPTGKRVETLTDQLDGQPYQSPNDVCLDLDGNIFFSDPSEIEPEGPDQCVYRISRQGAVTRVVCGLRYPN